MYETRPSVVRRAPSVLLRLKLFCILSSTPIWQDKPCPLADKRKKIYVHKRDILSFKNGKRENPRDLEEETYLRMAELRGL